MKFSAISVGVQSRVTFSGCFRVFKLNFFYRKNLNLKNIWSSTLCAADNRKPTGKLKETRYVAKQRKQTGKVYAPRPAFSEGYETPLSDSPT